MPTAQFDSGGQAASISLLWRVFAVNATVFLAAFGLLAASPITIHSLDGFEQAAILAVGLLAILLCDLLLLRRTLSPLRRLAAAMAASEPLRPGRRAVQEERAGREVLALARVQRDARPA